MVNMFGDELLCFPRLAVVLTVAHVCCPPGSPQIRDVAGSQVAQPVFVQTRDLCINRQTRILDIASGREPNDRRTRGCGARCGQVVGSTSDAGGAGWGGGAGGG